MKRSIIFSILASLLFLSCRKEDNPKIPDMIRVPVPLVGIDATSDKFISPVSPTAFKGKILVDMYFKTDVPPQKFDLVVMKNGNKSKVVVAKEGITSFPSVVDVTGTQLTSLFGEPMKAGDRFDIAVDITIQSGQKFLAFPVVGEPYGAGVFNQPGVNTAVQFLVPCPFVATEYAGDFLVVTDEWQDYSVGGIVPVKMVSATQLSFEYAVDAGSAKPIILNINPADNSITVAKQLYGTYGGEQYFAATSASPLNIVNPCDHSLTVRLNHTTAAGYSKDFTIKLKKK
jgi:hypothetical protein